LNEWAIHKDVNLAQQASDSLILGAIDTLIRPAGEDHDRKTRLSYDPAQAGDGRGLFKRFSAAYGQAFYTRYSCDSFSKLVGFDERARLVRMGQWISAARTLHTATLGPHYRTNSRAVGAGTGNNSMNVQE
jgi:hypothetical protein